MDQREKEFREKLQVVYDRVEGAMENVDPDVVECEQSVGTLTLILSDGRKCILSAQPSVRQLWLAIASRGTAYHFNYDPAAELWKDDKGQGIELYEFLRGFFKEVTGLHVQFLIFKNKKVSAMSAKVKIYTMENCPYCVRAKKLMEQRGISFQEIRVPEDDDAQWDALYLKSKMRTMPQIFLGEKIIGGYTDLAELDKKDKLESLK